jgi:hypothetical protein
LTGLKARVESEMESELIQVEAQTSILVPNKNVNRMNPQVRILPVQAQKGRIHPSGPRRAIHRADYRLAPAYARSQSLKKILIPSKLQQPFTYEA